MARREQARDGEIKRGSCSALSISRDGHLCFQLEASQMAPCGTCAFWKIAYVSLELAQITLLRVTIFVLKIIYSYSISETAIMSSQTHQSSSLPTSKVKLENEDAEKMLALPLANFSDPTSPDYVQLVNQSTRIIAKSEHGSHLLVKDIIAHFATNGVTELALITNDIDETPCFLDCVVKKYRVRDFDRILDAFLKRSSEDGQRRGIVLIDSFDILLSRLRIKIPETDDDRASSDDEEINTSKKSRRNLEKLSHYGRHHNISFVCCDKLFKGTTITHDRLQFDKLILTREMSRSIQQRLYQITHNRSLTAQQFFWLLENETENFTFVMFDHVTQKIARLRASVNTQIQCKFGEIANLPEPVAKKKQDPLLAMLQSIDAKLTRLISAVEKN